MAYTLKILMYREDKDFAAVCLEPYLVVRGADELEVRDRVASLFERYLRSGWPTVHRLGKAPDKYFRDWVETEGDPRALEVEIPAHGKVETEVKEYNLPTRHFEAILA